eukprot:Em0502g2a
MCTQSNRQYLCKSCDLEDKEYGAVAVADLLAEQCDVKEARLRQKEDSPSSSDDGSTARKKDGYIGSRRGRKVTFAELGTFGTYESKPGRKKDMLKALLSSKENSSKSQSCNSEKDVKPMDHFVTDDGIDLLSIKAVDPSKYALNLMSALFTDEELGSSCYKKRPESKSEKLPFSPSRIALLEECIEKKYGKETLNKEAATIQKKCNQKCLDTKAKLTKE